MKTSLTSDSTAAVLQQLQAANSRFSHAYPGSYPERQPVHTVYGGAQIFKADVGPKMGALALNTLAQYAPNFAIFAHATGLPGAAYLPETLDKGDQLAQAIAANPEYARLTNEPAWLAWLIYQRVVDKLKREAVEDFRIDFEDGYGNRKDEEEDYHATLTAQEVARGMRENTLPPFIGIRVKTLTPVLTKRAVRTLDIFISTLLAETNGQLPPGFVVTIPKVTIPEQVSTIHTLLGQIEQANGLAEGTLKMEIMVESTQSVIGSSGAISLPLLVREAPGRLLGAHFGTYDYTASCNIVAEHQHMANRVCDFAKHVMQVSLGGTGLMISDGATNIMPVPLHRGDALTAVQAHENLQAIHKAWKLHSSHIYHSLAHGFYQGWDLHPNQLPTRYGSIYGFFLRSLPEASLRLKTFLAKAAQATLVGDVFDDAATGLGLLNYFRRGVNCGAITAPEVEATGLTMDELYGRAPSPWLKHLPTA